MVMGQKTKLKYSVITDRTAFVNGHQIECRQTGSAMLTELYRAHVADWPKFFKMDTLSKVGFLASELLLKSCCEKRFEAEEYTSDRAVVLFGTTASLCADKNYQETIQDKDSYFPSPALFVYTLPNIVTGEIAIRNHYRGETSFYVLDEIDAHTMAFHIQCAFQDEMTESVLAGWVDSCANDDFTCFFTLVDRVAADDQEQLENELIEIIDKLK